MAEIRLNKLIRKYNIGLQNLVEFLKSKGAEIEENPNAKIGEEYLPAIEKQFGKDLEMKEASEKIDIKLTEILEKTTRKQKEEVEEDEYDDLDKETVIKSSILTHIAQEKPAQQGSQARKAEEPEETRAETASDSGEPVARIVPQEEAPAEEVPDQDVPENPEDKESVKMEETVEQAAPTPAAVETAAENEAETEESIGEENEGDSLPEEIETTADTMPEATTGTEKPEEATSEDGNGLRILGKIDLSQFDRKHSKKRERISKSSQKVDVAKEGRNADNSSSRKDKRDGGKPGAGKSSQESGKSGKKRQRGADKFKPVMTEEEQEAMKKEIQKQVKETYARMNDNKKSNFGAKYRKERRELAAAKSQEEIENMMAEKQVLKVTEFVTVNDLATLMDNTPVNEVIKACMDLGLMVSINQRLDAEALVLVAEQFGYKVEFVTAELTEELNSQEDREEDLVPRPPVITVMGHVDHGKTSLLDYIRKSNVIAGEAGGITQHIGAYNVKLPDGRRITFLDTPGHEAFTAMRARGAQLTDLAIIIIAADDAVMPQTVEAINHAQAAGVPMVFAINKIDKPGAMPEKIYQQLAQMNILTEAWGGKYQSQEISAKKGINVDKLLDKVLLETDLLELKANPDKNAVGAVIESSLDKGRGYLATVLVQEGTLRVGDMVLSGSYYGRIRAMFNERGMKVKEAGPSTPVSILGLNGAPSAGEKFNVMSDEKEAKAIANKREQLIRIQGIKTQKHMTLDEIGRRIAIGNFKELNVIVKGDVDGSVEALADS
ncbi:MAG: translation initiation factor IF-2, partial [Candidatus Cryptobacteroides sp.]